MKPHKNNAETQKCHLQDDIQVADEKKSTLRLCSIKTPSDLWVENNRKKSFKQPSYLVIQGQVAFNSKHPSRNGKAISFLDEKVESKVQYRIPFLGLWRQSCEQTKGQKKTCLPLLVATPMYPKTLEVGRVALKVVNF